MHSAEQREDATDNGPMRPQQGKSASTLFAPSAAMPSASETRICAREATRRMRKKGKGGQDPRPRKGSDLWRRARKWSARAELARPARQMRRFPRPIFYAGGKSPVNAGCVGNRKSSRKRQPVGPGKPPSAQPVGRRKPAHFFAPRLDAGGADKRPPARKRRRGPARLVPPMAPSAAWSPRPSPVCLLVCASVAD